MRAKYFVCAIFLSCAVFAAFASADGTDGQISALQNRTAWTLTERSNWSRYDNGKYVGHVYREVRASINQDGDESGGYLPYKGNFIVLEETLRDMRQSAKAVDNVVPVRFKMAQNGSIQIENDKGFPAMRNFPVYSLSSMQADAIPVGFTWTAEGTRAVDPLNNGDTIVYNFLAEYEYKGREIYKEIPVHHIRARYDSRFNPVLSGSLLKSLNGKHDVDILISIENGMLVLQRDNLDETFSWTNGNSTRFSGFTLVFGTGSLHLDKPSIVSSIKDTPGIAVENVETGVRLTINGLQFKSNSDELLSSEQNRLDLLAKSLSKIAGKTFLVEGHTASIGTPDSEMELSIQRAERIVAEMGKRGIPADRFMYKGWGGTRPVGDNETDQGRSENRRVEITILE
jgi:outer membrane protein OmpA-like peptidoglycan-associated protein